MPRFSICIPNYNYASYIGQTISSVLEQEGADLEVLVSDNASTDESVRVVQTFDDERVHLSINNCNVGFAANLDRAAGRARGDVLITLSSDDLMRPGALSTYEKIFEHAGEQRVVVSSAVDLIDAESRRTGRIGFDDQIWQGARLDDALTKELGVSVIALSARDLLRSCVLTMGNPFNFAATAFPRALYSSVEGYGGGRLMNPDKWFHWRLLAEADTAYFVDAPLFAYRWHAANQTAVQTGQGALKYLVDEYENTFELPDEVLTSIGLERADVVAAFIEHDIARHGLATLARGDRLKAARILKFGQSTYPRDVRRNSKATALRALLLAGPVGSLLAAKMYSRTKGSPPDR